MDIKAGVVRRDEAPSLWVVRDQIRFMGQVAGTNLEVLEVAVLPGSRTPLHRHASPEIFRLLEGRLVFGLDVGGHVREVSADPGTVVTIPPHAAHFYRNDGASTSTMLVVVERSMGEFFRDIGRTEEPPPAPPGPDEIAAVLEACARHGITIAEGPPTAG